MGKAERKFSQEQYDMLKRCSVAKDMAEWNDWRKKNVDADVLLEKADLRKFWLEGALLGTGWYNRNITFKGKVYLQGAILVEANLQGAFLSNANLQGANLKEANLQEASFRKANLQGAKLWRANLKESRFYKAEIQDADFTAAAVDGSTLIWDCKIDEDTNFTGVGLGNIRIDPESRQLLEYNVRRKRWERWYKWKDWYKDGHKEKRNIFSRFFLGFVRAFWWMSDYGSSTGRIIGVFFLLAFFFASVYLNLSYWFNIKVIHNLSIEPYEPFWHYIILSILRPIYFSIVTMTTLGFGDMYAAKQSILGHVLLIIQVLLGYMLLGALITRFAVLFTAGGPTLSFKDINRRREDSSEAGAG